MQVPALRVQNLVALISPKQNSDGMGATNKAAFFFPDPEPPETPPAIKAEPSKVKGEDSPEADELERARAVPDTVEPEIVGAVVPERTVEVVTPEVAETGGAVSGDPEGTEDRKASNSSNEKGEDDDMVKW
jgi:hypothetical protein